MLVIAWVLGLMLVPVERWLGTRRWIAVFACGHVVTTLLVAAGMWVAIRMGWIHAGVRHVVDVGVSYGFGAVAGVMAHRLDRRLGRAYAVIMLAVWSPCWAWSVTSPQSVTSSHSPSGWAASG
jgi:hypothetical protein